MEPNYVAVASLASILMLILIGSASSDLDKDRDKCADQLVGLATCLPYVGGDAKTPTIDCCTGLKQVLDKSKVCLCILVRDRDDPQLGLKINATLALSLPDKCHIPDANVSECPALLNLAPSSPDAKVFEEFAKGAKGNNSTSNAPAAADVKGTTSSGGKESSGGVRRMKWDGIEMGLGLVIPVLLHI